MQGIASRVLRGAVASSAAALSVNPVRSNDKPHAHRSNRSIFFFSSKICNAVHCSVASASERPTAQVFDIFGKWSGTRFPIYTAEEVALNDGSNGRPLWVTHADGVYDVGDFLRVHPGGDFLKQASGCSVEELWASFRVHLKEGVLKRLEEMRVGVLCEEDRKDYTCVPEPFYNEPMRSPELRVLMQRPFDADPHPLALSRNFITANSTFYVRNHFPVPPGPDEKEEGDHVLRVVAANTELRLTATELRQKYNESQLCATLMCTGGLARRVTGDPADGCNQISTAMWSGVRLCEVLAAAGVTPLTDGKEHRHLIMRGTDDFEVSVPLALIWQRAGHALIAHSMNGDELPRDHGWPLRVVVPGAVGVRSVKWLSYLEVADHESSSPWQKRLYRIWPQHVKTLQDKTFDDGTAPACYDIPIVSSILSPADGGEVLATKVNDQYLSFPASGWAFSGGGRRIVRVEVSADGGATWHQCNLQQDDEPAWGCCWSWTKWTAEVFIPREVADDTQLELQARAVDDAFSHQPEDQKTDWNMSGYLVSSRPRSRARITVRP